MKKMILTPKSKKTMVLTPKSKKTMILTPKKAIIMKKGDSGTYKGSPKRKTLG